MIVEFTASSMLGIQPVNEASTVPHSPFAESHFPDVKSHCQTKDSFPVSCSCPDSWTWNWNDRSPEVDLLSDPCSCVASCQNQHPDRLCGQQNRTAVFHPSWSNGTAAVRGTKPLDAFSVHYWEIHVSRRLFGTSLQFGVATKGARLHVDAFVNLLGEDEHSWALSHKGSLWHKGRCRQFAEPFEENESVTVGLLFDGPHGTLTYFKDGVCLGIAFAGLTTHPVGPPLYPVISSTAAKTEMTLVTALRSFNNLQDRCRATILRHLANTVGTIDMLPVPRLMKNYISELADVGADEHSFKSGRQHINCSNRQTTNKRQRSPRMCLKDWPEPMTS